MKTPVDLAYALTLPPEKAVAYYRRKGRRVSFDWHSMWKEAHATAFTVANCPNWTCCAICSWPSAQC
ncbi:MAG: hypothetical protein UEW31_00335 [Desulfovibrio sp.]|uniref:hypothetical protein n=1 Tax=Desulfovibrio sp. TaxID=885 RepID=UPI002E792AFA|nr:hypothetical protein [Desulfovibrio sp.]MEE0069749.1 hypothetical protein [Desulfovibrio sp.]